MAARAQAQEAADALMRGDFDQLVALTHVELVEAMGGRGRMLAALQRGHEEMIAQGRSFVGANTGRPLEIVRMGWQLRCVVPQTLKMQVPGGILEAKSAIIGVSMGRWHERYVLSFVQQTEASARGQRERERTPSNVRVTPRRRLKSS
ncbi:MAG: hypothetical protein ACM3PC_04025 [Deltaproteobacteria bacterium]